MLHSGNEPNPGMLGAVDAGVQAANVEAQGEAEAEARQQEANQIEAIMKAYNDARSFDKAARAQYAIDRRYAAGTAHINWAVSANLIGSFIDILVSFLYARNPDVSVKKAPQVDNRGTKQQDEFARTMELMISTLWRSQTSTLKGAAQKMVRSTLSVGVGWMKATLLCKGTNMPQMQTQLNDQRNNIAQLEAEREQLLSDDPLYAGEAQTPEEIDEQLLQMRELEESLSAKMEVALRKAMVFDFVRAEDIQVSLDVTDLADYKSANWIANAIYRTKDDTLAMCPRLTAQDLVGATCYYQRNNRDLQPLDDITKLTGLPGMSGMSNDMQAAQADQFVSDKSAGGTGPVDENQIEFYKIVERWNRVTGFIETMVEGCKRWAVEPFQPDYPTTRFYPYFLLVLFPVDGSRHPQSLTWRLFKLMDEYNSSRSSTRLTRDRAVPATLFNASGVPPEEAKKIQQSVQQEFIGINPTDQAADITKLFAAKPVAVPDMRLFDTTSVLQDMERISGVQEALQSAVTTEKTATEAEIQQTGFASRTTADRDMLEGVLTDLANYTGELALGGLEHADAVRMVGMKAFWPYGMAVDDLLTMVEITIQAGTTGKPKAAGDRDAWATIMPMLKQTMVEIQLAEQQGNLPLALALRELIRETLVRLGDDSDPERFIPAAPELPAVGAPGAPGMPGDPAAGGPAGDPGVSSEAPIGDLVAPELSAPAVEAPVIAPPA